MKATMAAAMGALCLWLAVPAPAHQLDEYLQATTISLEKNRIHMVLRLTPGVAVFPKVLAGIDTNGDKAISPREQKAYAGRVLRDLSLSLDDHRLPLQVVSWKFTSTQTMKEGRGYIELLADARVPRGGERRSLVFENHHQERIAVYLVNGLEPTDRDLQITSQERNDRQSFYRLDYVQTDGTQATSPTRSWWTSGWTPLAALSALVLLGQFALGWRKRKAPETRAARSL